MLQALLATLILAITEAVPDPTSPIITISIQNITVSYGARVKLFCEAAGFPKPKVRIMKRPPKQFIHNEVDFTRVTTPLETNSDVAVISNMRDSDEGWYYCRARNSQGIQMSRAYIGIKDKCAHFGVPTEGSVRSTRTPCNLCAGNLTDKLTDRVTDITDRLADRQKN
eukprot:sb/3472380/